MKSLHQQGTSSQGNSTGGVVTVGGSSVWVGGDWWLSGVSQWAVGHGFVTRGDGFGFSLRLDEGGGGNGGGGEKS